MDRLNNGTHVVIQNSGTGRPSVEGQSPRLQKKRSTARVESSRQPTALPAVRPQQAAAYRGSGPDATASGGGPGAGARKGSLRNVVRRIFGRRSKELETTPEQRSPPRHAYHRSEPPALSAHPPDREDHATQQEENVPQRTLSAPMHVIPPQSFERERTRSPYALQFPQSARLKPLALPAPFDAPDSTLRRRKTLPSILMSEQDAAQVKASLDSVAARPIPSLEITRDTPTPDIGLAIGGITQSKRRSRSADDLKRAIQSSSPPRKRSDEIRYWRDSFQGGSSLDQGSVLRASGFTVPARERSDTIEEQAGEKTPIARLADPFQSRESRSGTVGSSPPFEMRSTSAFGTEYSRDLEVRVDKLEAGLQSFQRMLQRMQADRNRRTAIIGDLDLPQRRNSGSARTPSMLAETLAFPLGPSDYQYDFTESQRPSTSPQIPRTPVRASPSSTQEPVPPLPQPPGPTEPVSTPSPVPITPGGNGNGNGGQPRLTQDVSFKSLYQMLNDERSARRKLENQMKTLKNELDTLQYQVQAQSTIQSQRSSYMLPSDPGVGSSRLAQLLRETGESEHPSPPRVSALSHEAVVSRFSGSTGQVESEGTQVEDEEVEQELQTPYEAYQTPTEESRGVYPEFGGRPRSREGEMF